MKFYSIVLAAILAVSCSTTVKNVSDSFLENSSSEKLAIYYHDFVSRSKITPEAKKKFESELSKRGVTDEEWKMIEQGKVRIGMSAIALYCSWGEPKDFNKTESAFGHRIQHIYKPPFNAVTAPTFVYTENGKVTNWHRFTDRSLY